MGKIQIILKVLLKIQKILGILNEVCMDHTNAKKIKYSSLYHQVGVTKQT